MDMGMNADPSMGGMGDSMPMGDPNAAGEDPNAMADPNMMGGDQENYGADFDAGVEVSEEEDPKKFIQQLTGKLSQSLRKYQGGLPQPDEETSKYVAGMIIPAATENISQDAKQEILDKVNGEGEDADAPAEGGEEMPPMDDPNAAPQEAPQQEQLTESDKKKLREMFQDIKLDKREDDEDKDDVNTTDTKPVTAKRKPYTAPKLRK